MIETKPFIICCIMLQIRRALAVRTMWEEYMGERQTSKEGWTKSRTRGETWSGVSYILTLLTHRFFNFNECNIVIHQT